MNFLNSFKQGLFSLEQGAFEDKALQLFNYQVNHNPVYKAYVDALGVDINGINCIDQIPFLPIEFYKYHEVKTGNWTAEAIYQSSGTTGQTTSKHFMHDTAFYKKVSERIFENQYGPLKNFTILALLPSYLERKNASLVGMMQNFIEKSRRSHSGFYLDDVASLVRKLKLLLADGKKVLLVGVTYALLDIVEKFELGYDSSNLIIMETGGMKGRRKEMVREELQSILSRGFGVPTIHSEYGMTELTSQAYAQEQGIFSPPVWMKISIREINDPFTALPDGRIGGVNIIDLANVTSCAFIETKDLGQLRPDGRFTIVGRFDNSELRGCNLMVS